MAKAKIAIENGGIRIVEEGKGKKFLKEVEQVTFSGKYAAKGKQEILYITERCVFRLSQEDRLVLVEVAPGIDIEKDILAHMDFKPEIAENVKVMDGAIFAEEWGGLKEMME